MTMQDLILKSCFWDRDTGKRVHIMIQRIIPEIPVHHFSAKGAIVVILSGILLAACSGKKSDHYYEQLAAKAPTSGTALKGLKQGAKRGNAVAEAQIGALYGDGAGVPKDYGMAAMWLAKAAKKGNPQAEVDLAYLYHTGQGVPQNDTKALKWISKAADQGFADAQDALGEIYEKGAGAPISYAKAAFWYETAAKTGNSNAQTDLGLLYKHGLGVSQNDAKAVKLFREAAAQGNTRAQLNLGMMYLVGRGVPRDQYEAMFWLHKAKAPFLARIKSDLKAISEVLDMYKLDNYQYPTSMQGLRALVKKPHLIPAPPNWHQYLTRMPIDPWGRPYKYLFPGSHNKPFDVWTNGPEGGSGVGPDAIGNWNVDEIDGGDEQRPNGN